MADTCSMSAPEVRRVGGDGWMVWPRNGTGETPYGNGNRVLSVYLDTQDDIPGYPSPETVYGFYRSPTLPQEKISALVRSFLVFLPCKMLSTVTSPNPPFLALRHSGI